MASSFGRVLCRVAHIDNSFLLQGDRPPGDAVPPGFHVTTAIPACPQCFSLENISKGLPSRFLQDGSFYSYPKSQFWMYNTKEALWYHSRTPNPLTMMYGSLVGPKERSVGSHIKTG